MSQFFACEPKIIIFKNSVYTPIYETVTHKGTNSPNGAYSACGKRQQIGGDQPTFELNIKWLIILVSRTPE